MEDLTDIKNNLTKLKTKLLERIIELGKNTSASASVSVSQPSPLNEYQKLTALSLIKDLNEEFKKPGLLNKFKPVIIGGFAVSQLSVLKLDSSTDIDVKICGPNLNESDIQKIRNSIPSEYKKHEQYGVKGDDGKINIGFENLNNIDNLPLLPVLRAKIISILDPKIQKLNAQNENNPNNPYLWAVRNSLRLKESSDKFLPENWPIKVFNGNQQIIDISFSLYKTDGSHSILCDSNDHTFKEGNLTFEIPMAKLELLAKNLLYYTSSNMLKKPEVQEKLPSWSQQIRNMILSVSAKLLELEQNKTNKSTKSKKGGKKRKTKKRKTNKKRKTRFIY